MNKLISNVLSSYLLSFIKVLCLASSMVISSFALAAAPLDVNSATAEQLAAVMVGVGQKKAQAIVQYREEFGAFSELDELVFVKGIGPSLLKKNRDYLSIGPAENYKGEKLPDLPL